MANSQVHSAITGAALLLQYTDTGDNKALIEDYSSYPDSYFSHQAKELAPYIFFQDGIQFHYPPDTPYTDLYRYWKWGGDRPEKSRDFSNGNFRHVTAGFSFYMEKVIFHLQKGEVEEGKKFLGCLLHMLEDAVFGFHALEGAGGADAFFLDRIMESSRKPSDILAAIGWRNDFPDLNHRPVSLGNSIDEAVMNLYAAYCRKTDSSRKCCFKYVMNTLGGKEENNRELENIMYENAVTICADVIHTLFQLAAGKISPRVSPCPLEDLEPYEFPCGGFGAYRFRFFERNRAFDKKNEPMELALGEDKFEHGLSFGSNWEGNLRYFIAPRTFREFRCKVGLHSAYPVTDKVDIKFINNGKSADVFTLDENNRSQEIIISQPENEFGLSFNSTPLCGIVVIADPLFTYLQ